MTPLGVIALWSQSWSVASWIISTGANHFGALPLHSGSQVSSLRELNSTTETSFQFSEPLTVNSPNRNPASVAVITTARAKSIFAGDNFAVSGIVAML